MAEGPLRVVVGGQEPDAGPTGSRIDHGDTAGYVDGLYRRCHVGDTRRQPTQPDAHESGSALRIEGHLPAPLFRLGDPAPTDRVRTRP